jgi:predicted DNA-binding helix-hairpin-helix protein
MVSLEKIAHLALESKFDSLGPAPSVDPKKLAALGEGTCHDVCASTYSPRMAPLPGICHAFTHDGRCVSLFKTLYTNHCSHECNYCTNASSCTSKARAFSYTPEELAGITLSLYHSNYIEGLFLSSGCGRDEDLVMEKIVQTARLLRQKYGFAGYIHLKVLPGTSEAIIKEAVELADRVSINLEASSASHMSELCATKNYESDILQRQLYIRDLTGKNKSNLPAGQTTQLVVGASDESDAEIFERIQYEYREVGVRRAYYSAFCPQKGTPFEVRSRQPLWREHRLYQMDWLFRVYRFPASEIEHAFDENSFLSNNDPKEAIARELLDSPLDPNAASYSDLLHIPGIGPRSAQRILALRGRQSIRAKRDLAALGVRIKRAAPFLKINGWRDATLEMWST